MHIFKPPVLSGMPASVAGILPLFALIDLTNAEPTLHWYQLSGRSMMWNWVIKPACARLLLSHDGVRACCLDQSGTAAPLNCIDGRWGNKYHCSSASTIRACMRVAPLSKIVLPPQPQPQPPPQPLPPYDDRPQRLRIILVSSAKSEEKKGHSGDRITTTRWYWAVVLVSGWVVFLAALVTTVLAELYIAASYLIVLLLTGVVIRESYGHCPRQIIATPQTPEFRRLVVATDNFNGDKWTAFIGPNWLVAPLLNKPLNQINPPTHLRLLQWLLSILVAFQWGLTIIACGYQDWNAFVVFAWIALSALASTFLHGERTSAESWLKSNGLWLERTDVKLSRRTAMLSLLVALNPDTPSTPSPFKPAKWINPILDPSKGRDNWESGLHRCLEKKQWEEGVQECLGPGLLFPSPLLKFRY